LHSDGLEEDWRLSLVIRYQTHYDILNGMSKEKNLLDEKFGKL
jgi:hypothetical protein